MVIEQNSYVMDNFDNDKTKLLKLYWLNLLLSQEREMSHFKPFRYTQIYEDNYNLLGGLYFS